MFLNQGKSQRQKILWGLLTLLLIGSLIFLIVRLQSPADSRRYLTLEQRIELAWDLAKTKATSTLNSLTEPGKRYPSITLRHSRFGEWLFLFLQDKKTNEGVWKLEKANFWASGAFPGILWQISAHESDPIQKTAYADRAKTWSEPLRKLSDPWGAFPSVKFGDSPRRARTKDMTLNNLIVFVPWYEIASGEEKAQQLATILQGAKILAQKDNFNSEIGTLGFPLKAKRDKRIHWQAFIDHTINVEQLLWAARHNPDPTQARDWQQKAIRHLKTLAATMGKNRNPGKDGTWQRGYFDSDPNSATYRQFLFNEAKQGWEDRSTWSRGQAWFIYGTSVTYQYTQDREVLAIAKQAINYYLSHLGDRFPGKLRRAGDFIPPWDFDYALEKNPDTQRDSSAAAIAVAGMLKLLQALPTSDADWVRYWQDIEQILYQLTSTEYLPNSDRSGMSLLQHGCYHHFEAIKPSEDFDNGTIWGDYFFLDALKEYQQFVKTHIANPK